MPTWRRGRRVAKCVSGDVQRRACAGQVLPQLLDARLGGHQAAVRLVSQFDRVAHVRSRVLPVEDPARLPPDLPHVLLAPGDRPPRLLADLGRDGQVVACGRRRIRRGGCQILRSPARRGQGGPPRSHEPAKGPEGGAGALEGFVGKHRQRRPAPASCAVHGSADEVDRQSLPHQGRHRGHAHRHRPQPSLGGAA